MDAGDRGQARRVADRQSSTSTRRSSCPPATAPRCTPRSPASTAAWTTSPPRWPSCRASMSPSSADRCAVYFDEGAVAHTFAVAAGLDSMVVGENQILGQVRAALTACQTHGTVGTVLNALFQQAIRVGKRVHTETEVGSAGRSLVTAAYELLDSRSRTVAGRRVLVLGRRVDGRPRRPDRRGGRGAGDLCQPHLRARAAAGRAAIGGSGPSARRADRPRSARPTGGGLHRRPRRVPRRRAAAAHAGASASSTSPCPADVADRRRRAGVVLVNLARLVADQPDHASRAAGRGRSRDWSGPRSATSSDSGGPLRWRRRSSRCAPWPRRWSAPSWPDSTAGLPELTDRERDEVHRTVRRVVDKLLHQPTVRVQELASRSASRWTTRPRCASCSRSTRRRSRR